jgi:hypothetical protein
MTIDAMHAASASGSRRRRKPTDLFGGDVEKFALTETGGYSAWRGRTLEENSN